MNTYSNHAPTLTVVFLPSYSGDGYGYGGGTLITCGDIAISVGENHPNNSERSDLARRIVRECNSHAALVAANAELHETAQAAANRADDNERKVAALVAALHAACNALSELATSLPGGQAQIFADNAADAASAALKAAQEKPNG